MTTKYPQLSNKSWLEEEIQTKPLRQIAEEVGCSYAAVNYAVRRFEVTVPQRFSRRQLSPDKSQNIKRALEKRYPNGRFGELASNWKGGRHIYNGYVYVHAPDHPRAGRARRVQEHILIMEEILGRYIDFAAGEEVHHINHDTLDNRPENLQLKMKDEHLRDHWAEGYEAAQLKIENEALRRRIAKLEAGD